MADYLRNIVKLQKQGKPVGIYSACTGNRLVLEACMRHALKTGTVLLIESTANQVDQYGGYTGMKPADFMEMCKELAKEVLAVGIGTSHGVYKGVPRVNVERLSEIRALVDIPLVLHGTSGVPDEQVRDCVSRGICKVNYATDPRIAFTKGVKAYMQENPDAFDPKKYSARGMEEVKAYVMQKMEVVGSIGKAAN